ncbi:hypothetical protein P7C70_g4252, partial [Phenoliferia sp. Uapishka_3]
MRVYFAEFLGTFILVVWGEGTQAQVVAARKEPSDYLSVAWGWGVGFMLAIYVSSGISGGHINPAVTIALCLFRRFHWSKVPGYIFAQLLGGFLGGGVIFGIYYNPLHSLDNFDAVLTTGPASLTPTVVATFFSVFIGAALLMGAIAAFTDTGNNPATPGLTPLLLGLVMVGIASSFGYQTGFVLNPARDLGPRLFLWLTGSSRHELWIDESAYGIWTPAIGATTGAIFGIFLYDLLIYNGRELPRCSLARPPDRTSAVQIHFPKADPDWRSRLEFASQASKGKPVEMCTISNAKAGPDFSKPREAACRTSSSHLQPSPPTSNSRRRSPTPDPAGHSRNTTAQERQRATSFGEQTPKPSFRQLAPESPVAPSSSSVRSMFGGAPAPPQPGSGRASPNLSIQIRPVRQNSYPAAPVRAGSATSPLKTLESYNARNVAAALENGLEGRPNDDVWQSVCLRVLPLFNGEGHRGFVEDLNELVISHVQRTFARCQQSTKSRAAAPTSSDVSSLVTGYLTADLSELISIGCLTLAGKLAPSPPAVPLADEQFLLRLNELWSFMWTGVLPHLESVFWVLRSDERLRAAVVGGGREREREGRTLNAEGRIDVRRLALAGFRDQLIHPQYHRILHLFRELYDSRPPSRQPSRPSSPPNTSPSAYQPTPSQSSSGLHPTPAPTVSTSPSNQGSTLHPPQGPLASVQAANARRRQMIAVLASLLTGDERQHEIDNLLSQMRAGLSLGSAGRRTPAVQTDATVPPAGTLGDRRAFAHLTAQLTPSVLENGGGGGALPVSASWSRPRAGTLDSLDEEGTAESSTVDVQEGSMTPPAVPGKVKRRGFLPKLGRQKSTNESVSTASTVKTISGPLVSGGGGGEGEEEVGERDRSMRSPKLSRWGRTRSGSGREDGSEGTNGT